MARETQQKDRTMDVGIKVALDLLALFLAANIAFDLRYNFEWKTLLGEVVKGGGAPWGELYRAIPYLLFSWYLIFGTFGLYRPGLARREEMELLIKANAVAFVMLFAGAFFYRGFSYSRLASLLLVPIGFLFSVGFRMLFRNAKQHLLKMRPVQENVLIVGHADETEGLVTRLRQPEMPYTLLGCLVPEGQPLGSGLTRLGGIEDLAAVLRENEVDRVLLISRGLTREQLMQCIEQCYRLRASWAVVPDLYDLLMDRLRTDQVAGVPVLGPSGSSIVGLNMVVKRAVDVVTASLLLLALSPILLLVALLIRLTSPGPILFVQKRVGRNGKVFDFYKFRSMYSEAGDRIHRQIMETVIRQGSAGDADAGKPLFKMKRDPRITPAGLWMRRFSVDELPQLLNVIKGDMSLVGPRPPIPYEVDLYKEEDLRRLQALPGITGLWQVSGRNRLSFRDMVELDVQYIENWSMGLDIRIFFKTLVAVFLSRGY